MIDSGKFLTDSQLAAAYGPSLAEPASYPALRRVAEMGIAAWIASGADENKTADAINRLAAAIEKQNEADAQRLAAVARRWDIRMDVLSPEAAERLGRDTGEVPPFDECYMPKAADSQEAGGLFNTEAP